MKRTTILTLCLVLAGLAVPAGAVSGDVQTTDVLAFADLEDRGETQLWRTDDGIRTRVRADLPQGVYTMWWVVWNTPEGCADPFACNEPDLFDPEGDTGLAIGYGGGAVVGPDGTFSLQSRLAEGATLTRFPYPEFSAVGVSLTETTLVDSDHAEIHLVFRSHGDIVPGMLRTQRATFNGACTYQPPLDSASPIYGDPGPNTCEDQFFAVFPSIDTP